MDEQQQTERGSKARVLVVHWALFWNRCGIETLLLPLSQQRSKVINIAQSGKALKHA